MSPPERSVVLTPLPGEANLGLVDGLAQLAFTVQGALGRIVATNDLSIVQVRLLGILRDRRPTIKELAEFLRLDKSSVTGLVDRAEDRGLVRRVPSNVDGRSVGVSITAAGRKRIERVTAAFEAEVADLVRDLNSSQRRQLSAAATAIVAADARRQGIDIFSTEGSSSEPAATVAT